MEGTQTTIANKPGTSQMKHSQKCGSESLVTSYYVKWVVFVPPMTQNVEELKTMITAAFKIVTSNMLQRVWEELEYRLVIVRISRGGHIEQLQTIRGTSTIHKNCF